VQFNFDLIKTKNMTALKYNKSRAGIMEIMLSRNKARLFFRKY
jgi:hypothetical protein